MGHAFRYSFSSYLRLLRKGLSVFLLRNCQLRPDSAPNIREKRNPRHFSAGEFFNLRGMLDRHRATARNPRSDNRWPNIHMRRKRNLPTSALTKPLAQQIDRLVIHAPILAIGLQQVNSLLRIYIGSQKLPNQRHANNR